MPETLVVRLRNFEGYVIKETEISFVKTQEHASAFTFEDEGDIREKYFYPAIEKGDVLVDVGAAYGSYTIPALKFGARKVICFSPQIELPALKKNIALNKTPEQEAIVYPHGLYSKYGFLSTDSQKFFKTKIEAMKNFTPINENDSVINVYALDNKRYQKVLESGFDILKIDVEGAEHDVLVGARKTLIKYKPKLILVECHTFKDGDVKNRVESFMSNLDLGYKKRIHERPGINVFTLVYNV